MKLAGGQGRLDLLELIGQDPCRTGGGAEDVGRVLGSVRDGSVVDVRRGNRMVGARSLVFLCIDPYQEFVGARADAVHVSQTHVVDLGAVDGDFWIDPQPPQQYGAMSQQQVSVHFREAVVAQYEIAIGCRPDHEHRGSDRSHSIASATPRDDQLDILREGDIVAVVVRRVES